MNTLKQVMAALRKKGNPERIQVFSKHGAPADKMFGVSVADLQVIAKQIKGNQQLALALYDTGISDAMYLSGLVADGALMTKAQLDAWAKNASWQMISEYTVPRVACDHPSAHDLARKWIKSRKEHIAACGWNTYAGLLAITEDADLDTKEIRALLKQIEQDLDESANRVKYCMNGFVISVGTYVVPLVKAAKATAKKLGKVEVDMHGTTCKVPLATEYIMKVEKMGRTGKKRKTIKC